ncbi:hypothetical protein [Paenibacillus brevis]|nr:hypothetical protein [Paenibacillus brevis]
MFKSKDFVRAVEFTDFASIQMIVQLTGMGMTLDVSPTGSLRSITLKNGTTTVVAIPGQFVYKTNTGTVGVCNLEYLEENFEEVTPAE